MSEDSMIRKAAGVQVSVSSLLQGAITLLVGYLLQMVLGMDARLARQEEQIRALGRESELHAKHAAESIAAAEKAHSTLWESLRRKQDKKE